MRTILNLLILMLQGLITLITLVVIYMLFVLMNYQGGIDGFIGTTLFQPIIGGLISIVTIGICLLIGLPIRLSNRINSWWTKRFWLAILGVILGLTFIVISLLLSTTETKIFENNMGDNEVIKQIIPNLVALITGWFLTAFSLLHLFPPYKFRRWAEEMISKYTGWGKENARQHFV